jgi:hypothetical protein
MSRFRWLVQPSDGNASVKKVLSDVTVENSPVHSKPEFVMNQVLLLLFLAFSFPVANNPPMQLSRTMPQPQWKQQQMIKGEILGNDDQVSKIVVCDFAR